METGSGYVDKLKDLLEHVSEAEALLWERMQLGNFDSPVTAIATMKAYEQVTKAQKIIAENLGQLPLPLVDKVTGELRS